MTGSHAVEVAVTTYQPLPPMGSVVSNAGAEGSCGRDILEIRILRRLRRLGHVANLKQRGTGQDRSSEVYGGLVTKRFPPLGTMQPGDPRV